MEVTDGQTYEGGRADCESWVDTKTVGRALSTFCPCQAYLRPARNNSVLYVDPRNN
jgi:hypothetical protein